MAQNIGRARAPLAQGVAIGRPDGSEGAGGAERGAAGRVDTSVAPVWCARRRETGSFDLYAWQGGAWWILGACWRWTSQDPHKLDPAVWVVSQITSGRRGADGSSPCPP